MNILHLENNANDAELIERMLRKSWSALNITLVDTREAFIRALDLGGWDFILADYWMPGFDGISALKLAVGKRPQVPFIFVTGSLGEDLAIETLKNGAIDFVLKHRLDRLPQAMTRALRERRSAQAQKLAEQRLQASCREKDILLQEVHHRVKNNLQIICSLLSMQSDSANDPALASALRGSERRIHSMALIHEMLYASTSLSDIDFSEYVRTLTATIVDSCGADADHIGLILELEPVRLQIDRAIPCGLILNELLSNIFKYAFPSGNSGEVRVSLRQEKESIRLAVEDTGIGLPGNFSPSSSKSLGFKIINVLTRQIGGSMEVISDHGARFALRFSQPVVNA